jgi:protein-S-isoprenylcysteine O-methyltransferase Ste14
MSDAPNTSLARGAFWASATFYTLVALEFFYMLSPFAAYAYGVYGPGLQALQLSSTTSWLIGFFMPHIARETSSLLITWHEAIGAAVLVIGLVGFAIGASQIYWSKLRGNAAVTHRMYRWVRHPQYLALMIASFGMLLIWPRYLVVVGFMTMCFAYYLLARIEEHHCKRQFADYADYAARTGMFLPRLLYRRAPISLPTPTSRSGRVVGGLLRLDADTIAKLVSIAKAEPRVQSALAQTHDDTTRFINYVMPVDLMVSEVPMHVPPGARTGHQSPSTQDQRRYKVIFTQAHFGAAARPEGRTILRRAIHKTALIEVWIDRATQQVVDVYDPPAEVLYDGIPVPVF